MRTFGIYTSLQLFPKFTIIGMLLRRKSFSVKIFFLGQSLKAAGDEVDVAGTLRPGGLLSLFTRSRVPRGIVKP